MLCRNTGVQTSVVAAKLPASLRRLIFPDELFRPDNSTKPLAVDGVVANARVTALLGAVLVVVFSAEGVTLLNLSGLLEWHVGLGVAAAVVVTVKLFSTGYRMLRYYGRDGRYVASGPPHPVMRALAPLLVVATVSVIATGLATLYYPDGMFRSLHKLSFIGWIGLAAVHVLVYFWRLPRVICAPRGAKPGLLTSPILTWVLIVLAVAGAATLAGWYLSVMPPAPAGGYEHH